MLYDRKIRYLDYLDGGSRLRSAGFVKTDRKDGLCNIQVQVGGLHLMDRQDLTVRARGGGKEVVLGGFPLRDGKGGLYLRHRDAQDLGGSGEPSERISYEELEEIFVDLGKGRELACRWREPQAGEATLKEAAAKPGRKEIPGWEVSDAKMPLPWDAPVGEEEVAVPALFPKPRQSEASVTIPQQLPDVVPELILGPRQDEIPAALPKPRQDEIPAAPPKPHQGEASLVSADLPDLRQDEASATSSATLPEPPHPPRLYEDKWEQLSSIYPHITPFQDKRGYLRIGPEDFVVLQKQYHRLVANSFLLHGYYHYGHLILARVRRMGELRYYVGVPGNFYEKEKEVAVLFGFESFECKQEPVRDGDFGYYCIRVDL